MPTIAHRAYFVFVGLFALWVGAWGFAMPAEVGRALPWTVPPLHARFIAAMYLAGALAMGWSLLMRRLELVRIPIALAAIWTGALLVVSLVRLGDFDFGKPQVWFWMGAYIVFPLWGMWLYLRDASIEASELQEDLREDSEREREGGNAREHARDREEDRELDPVFISVAIVCLLLALAMIAAPSQVAGVWPWPISPLLASIYAGPFFAYGAAAVMLAREASSAARRIVVASMLAFTVLTLIASLMHLGLFHFNGFAAWVWFAGFAAAGAVFAARLVQTRNWQGR